jgi:putative lipoic acid-binding regulatory protein
MAADHKKLPPIYPCVFPVKIVGECCEEFEANVLSVMKNYIEGLTPAQFGRRLSRGGKYLSLTINVFAKDREYIEKLYAELNAQEKVITVI